MKFSIKYIKQCYRQDSFSTSSSLQSWKWRWVGSSKCCCGALRGNSLHELSDG